MQVTLACTRLAGVKRITAAGWDGEPYQFSRKAFEGVKQDGLFQSPGVYILYADHFDKQKFGRDAYVGQGDEVFERINQHLSNRPFWTTALLFKADWMTVAHTFNIEGAFIEAMRLAGRYVLQNRDKGQEKHLSDIERKRCNDFQSGAKQVAAAANVDVFTPNVDGVFEYSHPTLGQTQLRVSSIAPRQVVLLQGSWLYFSSRTNDTFAEELQQRGLAKVEGNRLVFAADAEVAIDRNSFSPGRLTSTRNYKNACGASAHEFLKGASAGLIAWP